MILIELHIGISILLLLTAIGHLILGKEQIRENGWFSDDLKKKNVRASLMKNVKAFLIFFIPILNIVMLLFVMTTVSKTKEEFEEYIKDLKGEDKKIIYKNSLKGENNMYKNENIYINGDEVVEKITREYLNKKILSDGAKSELESSVKNITFKKGYINNNLVLTTDWDGPWRSINLNPNQEGLFEFLIWYYITNSIDTRLECIENRKLTSDEREMLVEKIMKALKEEV